MNRGVSRVKKQQVIGTRIVSSMPCLQLGDSVTKSSAKVTKKRRGVGGERCVRACFSLGDCTSCDIDAGGCSSLPSSLLLCHLFFFL